MELVNTVYRYMNRFINSDELINLLENIDTNKLNENEIKELNKLISEVKEIINTVNNEIDTIEEERINSYNRVKEILSTLLNDENYDDEIKNKLKENYDKLLQENERKRDCGPRYEKIVNLLSNNLLYKNKYENMNDKELLDYITQFISAPNVPEINQETFDKLVNIAIQENNKETLWRLAFNYNKKNIDFSDIEDYFIKEKDDYYLIELICAVEEDLNMERLVDKVFNTNDKEFIIKCGNRANELDIFTEEEKNKIRQRLNNL